MTRRTRLILSAAAAVAVTGLLAAGVVHLTGAKGAGLPAVGQVIPAAQRPPGPAISGTTLTGQRLDIAGWRGHTVVINFWGSWCVPCRTEAPVLRRVASDTRALGVRFAGIDIREDPAAGLAFERQYHIPYPSISDPGDLIAARFGAVAPTATHRPTSWTLAAGSPGPGSARPATASSSSRSPAWPRFCDACRPPPSPLAGQPALASIQTGTL